MTWPEWWLWELEISPHIEKRMHDRGFGEVDLRAMLQDASGYRPDLVEGRWVIETRHAGAPWEVILEPDMDDKRLVAVTAYPVD
ncbi:MAG: DUF4258 domain-containing protein [Planctomycetes bacterium]|nr:DUF4258 domain-containing protein [Planctomycetota bacterium]